MAFIRGINVGTAKRVAMAELRGALIARGLADVTTLLNSGNVVFEPRNTAADDAALVAQALQEDCGVQAGVVVLSASDLSAIIKANTLTSIATDPSRLFVTIYADAADRARFTPLTATNWKPDALQVGDRAVYAWCVAGATGSTLAKAVARVMGPRATTRNWTTMLRVAAVLF